MKLIQRKQGIFSTALESFDLIIQFLTLNVDGRGFWF